jgi:D-alanine--poly(phosphoribitol) ligase subunit 2
MFMSRHERIQSVVLTALDEVNQQLPPTNQFKLSADTVLFGRGGVLDSLGLVNLIVAVEQRLEDELGMTLVLADEKAMAQKNSPFRTVATLVDYILQQMDDHAHV